jgi:hypothetical protein
MSFSRLLFAFIVRHEALVKHSIELKRLDDNQVEVNYDDWDGTKDGFQQLHCPIQRKNADKSNEIQRNNQRIAICEASIQSRSHRWGWFDLVDLQMMVESAKCF